jgi:sRNA-binding carbon storage regulator CsrA
VAVHREEIFDRIQREAELAQRADQSRGSAPQAESPEDEASVNSNP